MPSPVDSRLYKDAYGPVLGHSGAGHLSFDLRARLAKLRHADGGVLSKVVARAVSAGEAIIELSNVVRF